MARARLGCLLMLCGFGGIVIGSFLHWFATVNFWDLIRSDRFKLFVALVLVVMVAECVMLFSRGLVPAVARLAGAAALLGFGTVLGVILSLASLPDVGGSEIGWWIALLGCLAVGAGGVIASLASLSPGAAGGAGVAGGSGAGGSFPLQRPTAMPLMIGGAAVTAIGSFLHWFSHESFWKYWSSTTYKTLVIVAFVGMAATSFAWLSSRRAEVGTLAALFGLAGAGAVIGIDLWGSSLASTEIGWWVTILGALAIGIGGFAAAIDVGATGAAPVGAVAGGYAPGGPQGYAPGGAPGYAPAPQQPVAPGYAPAPQQPVAPGYAPAPQQPVAPAAPQAAPQQPPAAPQQPAAPQAATAPGWYRDPWGQANERYHDGAQWTGHTR